MSDLEKPDLLVEDERHAAEERLPDLEQEDEPEHGGGDGEAVAPEEAHQRPGHGAREPGDGAPECARDVEAGRDPGFVLGLRGDAFCRRRFPHEQEAHVAQDDDHPEHQEGGLPVVLDPCALECRGRLQRDRPAELVSRPPPHHRGGRPRRHRLALRLADLLDPKGIDRDVLGRGRDGDDEADGDHPRQVGRRVDGAPQDQGGQDHRLQRDDPGAAVSDPVRQPGHPDPIDKGRPQKVEGVDAEDEAGPADGAAAEAVLLQPEAEAAADQHPREAADDPEQEDAGHPPLEVEGQRLPDLHHPRELPPDGASRRPKTLRPGSS